MSNINVVDARFGGWEAILASPVLKLCVMITLRKCASSLEALVGL